MTPQPSATELLFLLAAKPAHPGETALGLTNGNPVLAATLFADAMRKGIVRLMDEGRKAHFVAQWHQLPIPEAKGMDAVLPQIFRTLTDANTARTVSSLGQSLSSRIAHPALIAKVAEAMGVWTTEHKRLFGLELTTSRQIAADEAARANAVGIFRQLLVGKHQPELHHLLVLRFVNQAGQLHRVLEMVPAQDRSTTKDMLKAWLSTDRYSLPMLLTQLESNQLNALNILTDEVRAICRKD